MKPAHRNAAIAALWALGAWSAAAAAGTAALDQLLHLDLRLRYYRFNKLQDKPAEADQRSSAVGGMLELRTMPPWLGGIGLGAGLYGAWATQSFPPGDPALEQTLMGPGPRLSSLGEAFAQFERGGVLVRIGRQRIKTPWVGPNDSRMLPQTYSGVRAQYTLSAGLKLVALDLQKYKSRSSSGFTRDNLYYPPGYQGDPLADAVAVFPNSAIYPRLPEAPGTLAMGAVYPGRTHRERGLHAQLWYYDFREFAETAYVDGGYTFGALHGNWAPYLDAQLMRQSGGGELERYGATQFGVGGPVDSALFGMRAGLKHRKLDLSLSYDELQHRRYGFGGGAIISPYGEHAAMYAGEMTEHLLKYGPGHVLELKATSGSPGDALRLRLGVLAFRTRYSGDSNALYFDGRFSLQRWVTGLRLRERLIWMNGAKIWNGAKVSASRESLVYNRLMLEYRLQE